MKRLLRRITRTLSRVDPTDILDVVGIALLVTAAALVYAPAAYAVAGGSLIATSYRATRPPRPERTEDETE